MKKKKLILKNVIQETEDTKTLVFAFPNGADRFDFLAGQYLHLFIGDESKMYTISSAPHENEVKVTVKAEKNFSLKLHALKEGDEIEYLGPMGFLTLEEREENQREKDIIFLAAGIGITPFFSMIQAERKNGFSQRMTLFYANKNKKRTVFYDALEDIQKESENFHVYHYWSEEENKLNYEKIREKVGKENMYYICGPTQFVEDFWKALKDDGVDEDDILTESFFIQ